MAYEQSRPLSIEAMTRDKRYRARARITAHPVHRVDEYGKKTPLELTCTGFSASFAELPTAED